MCDSINIPLDLAEALVGKNRILGNKGLELVKSLERKGVNSLDSNTEEAELFFQLVKSFLNLFFVFFRRAEFFLKTRQLGDIAIQISERPVIPTAIIVIILEKFDNIFF